MDQEDVLKRYYRGETTVSEERELKAAFRQGKLANEPVLVFRGEEGELPAGLIVNIQRNIYNKNKQKQHRRLMIIWGMASMLILLISIRGLIPRPNKHIQLSDNLKKERFEGALRVIGKVLEEKTPEQKVLYEDSKLIIVIE